VPELAGRRVLVIGGAGLIGSHVVEALLEAPVAEVVVYDDFSRGSRENLEPALRDRRCRIFEPGADILQLESLDAAMAGCDLVVHLAALWLLQCEADPRAAFEVNMRGTFNVLEACVRNRVQRLVYSSSASVYGDALEEPMTEDHPYNNETFYGATKIAGEHMFKAFHARYGLPGVCLRYMNVYGPRQDTLGAYVAVTMRMLDCLERGESPVVFGDGTQSYDFIHVRDVARANVCALASDVPWGCYNVGRGVKTSINELARLLCELTGSQQVVRHEPGGTTFVTQRVGCPKAAARDLDFRWSIDLREGMRSLIAWRQTKRQESAPSPAA
jgi:UDP-glucose 4-epimerase